MDLVIQIVLQGAGYRDGLYQSGRGLLTKRKLFRDLPANSKAAVGFENLSAVMLRQRVGAPLATDGFGPWSLEHLETPYPVSEAHPPLNHLAEEHGEETPGGEAMKEALPLDKKGVHQMPVRPATNPLNQNVACLHT